MLKNITFPKEGEKKENDVIRKLRTQLRKLTKENKILKSENKQLKRAWEKTESKIKDIVSDVSLEDLLDESRLSDTIEPISED